MKVDLDDWSAIMRKFIGILLLDSPVRTAFGVLLGVLVNAIFLGLGVVIKIIDQITERLNTWHYLALGILLINLPNIYHLVGRRSRIPENVEKVFEGIKELEKTGLYSKSQIKLLYLETMNNLIKSVSEELKPNAATNKSESSIKELN